MDKNILYCERFGEQDYRFAWVFDPDMKEIIKQNNNGDFKWSKNSKGVWYIVVNTNNAASRFYDLFKLKNYQINFTDSYKNSDNEVIEDTDDNINNNIDNAKKEVSSVKNPAPVIDYTKPSETITVQRHKKIINKLSVFVPDSLIDMMLTLDYVDRVKKTNEFTIFIEDIIKLYDFIRKQPYQYNFRGIGEWLRIVNEWKADYAPVPLSCKFEPRPFQLEDVDILLKKHKCILGNDMGCGKTHEAVRVGMALPMKKLIICPATLRLNWEEEIRMVDPHAEIEIIYNKSKKVTLKEWNIIGYPSVDMFSDILEKAHIQCIFIDEAHYCQAVTNGGQPNSKRALAVLRLTATAGWVYPITGTPITNRNKNLYNILQMISHPLVKRNNAFFTYGKRYCNGQRNDFGWDFEGNSNSEELHTLIKSYMVRHLKSEVLPDLKKQRQSIPLNVNLNGYNKALKEYYDNLDTAKDKKNNILSLLMKARMSLAKEKTKSTIELADSIIQSGNQVIITTCFVDVVTEIEKHFKGNVAKIVGGMTDAKKQEAKNRFQNKEIDVMILNIDAGGVGITLTAAHYMIINDLAWTTGQHTQVEDRICRTGQEADYSIIYYMTAKGAVVEEQMVNSLTNKASNINTVIDGGGGEELDFIKLVQDGQPISN